MNEHEKCDRSYTNEELVSMFQDGDESAFDRLLSLNRGAIFSIVRKYLPHNGRAVLMDDLVQDASMALLKAAQRFETGRGVSFMTYAWWEMRNAVQRGTRTAHAFTVSYADADLIRTGNMKLDQHGSVFSIDSEATPGKHKDNTEVFIADPDPYGGYDVGGDGILADIWPMTWDDIADAIDGLPRVQQKAVEDFWENGGHRFYTSLPRAIENLRRLLSLEEDSE